MSKLKERVIVAERYPKQGDNPGFILWYLKTYRYYKENKNSKPELKICIPVVGCVRNHLNTLKRVIKEWGASDHSLETHKTGRYQALIRLKQFAFRFKAQIFDEQSLMSN